MARQCVSLVVACLLLLSLCEPNGSASGTKRASEQLARIDFTHLRGQSIRDAVRLAGVAPERCAIFDEPPGVARGVTFTSPFGATVQLWLARNDGVFPANRNWTFAQIAARTVVAVECDWGGRRSGSK